MKIVFVLNLFYIYLIVQVIFTRNTKLIITTSCNFISTENSIDGKHTRFNTDNTHAITMMNLYL